MLSWKGLDYNLKKKNEKNIFGLMRSIIKCLVKENDQAKFFPQIFHNSRLVVHESSFPICLMTKVGWRYFVGRKIALPVS